MLSVLSTSPGLDNENFDIRDVEVPNPGTDEFLVKVLASSINYSDVVTLSGAYPSRTSYPFVPGFEGVGEVVACGLGADPSVIGRHVIALRGAGNWQQYRIAHTSDCVHVPISLPPEMSSFSYINPMTALLMARSVDSSRRRTALLSAPGSVMGKYLAELLSGMGVHVVGLSSGRSSIDTLSGFAGVVESRDVPGWSQRLNSKLPSGADLILDCVGGETLRLLLDFSSPHAHCVQYGLLSGDPKIPDRFNGGNMTFEYFYLRKHMYNFNEQETAAAFESVFNLLREGRFEAPTYREVELSSVPEEIVSGRWSSRPRVLIRPHGVAPGVRSD